MGREISALLQPRSLLILVAALVLIFLAFSYSQQEVTENVEVVHEITHRVSLDVDIDKQRIGGHKGYDKVVWEVAEHKQGENPSITFKYHSHDGEEGYPGDLSVTATYTLTSATTLRLDMEAVPENKPTPVSLAQHTYWNLGGHDSGNVLDHSIRRWLSVKGNVWTLPKEIERS